MMDKSEALAVEVERLKAEIGAAKAKQRKYKSKRKEKLGVVTLELSYLALAGLQYAALEAGISRAALVNARFEALAVKHGLEPLRPKEQPPETPRASQVVTPAKELAKTLADWDNEA
jgi:hypothetical protein